MLKQFLSRLIEIQFSLWAQLGAQCYHHNTAQAGLVYNYQLAIEEDGLYCGYPDGTIGAHYGDNGKFLHPTFPVSFWFSFVDCVLICSSIYVFVWLYLDVLVVYAISLHVGHGCCYAVSNTHWVATQHILEPLSL